VVGKTIEETGIHDLGVVLFQIRRRIPDSIVTSKSEKDEQVLTVSTESTSLRSSSGIASAQQFIVEPEPSTVLQAGDVLHFAGVVEGMQRIYDIPGLVPATAEVTMPPTHDPLLSMPH
jgi:uncharacterized transporter YbjL